MDSAMGALELQSLLRILHDEKLGVERMADSARLLRRILGPMALPEDANRAMCSITRGCAHLLQAYRELSETHAMRGLCPVRTNVTALVRRTAAQYMATALLRNVRLCCRCAPDDWEAELDPVLMERLLSNLIANALHHARRGGWVQVKLSRREDCLVLSVRDNGRGIAKSLLPRIFDPYVVGGPREGSGLGLANVQRIAALHGGSARCASREGVGTLMTVSIPL